MVDPVSLAEVKAFIAHRLLRGGHDVIGNKLGSITLREHQVTAVERIRSAIEEFGGALLCDEVGTGKTFVALALCEDSARVIAPAVLRDMWNNAASAAGKCLDFTSTESLSRARHVSLGTGPNHEQLLIVDEAHHFRNPRTRRYQSLARLADGRAVLLLTATPVHNRRSDLEALLSLFIGSRAHALRESEMARIVVRREKVAAGIQNSLPIVEPPVWCELRHDEVVPQLLLGLPPPLPPRDGGDGGALVLHSLLRQWSSSNAALERALTRRLHRSFALIAALESGTYPSELDLAAWTSAEDSVQLTFAELIAAPSAAAETLLPVIREHRDAVASLLQFLKSRPGADVERAETIRRIRRTHSGVSVVAFSQYADTISALFRELARDGGVAALTGNGGRVAGGRISRQEAINRFAPAASGVSPPRAADAVSMLLTTDLLSEGVNLQDAGVVVHIDLPWTPARMEQRVGRVARMGSPHARVFTYVIRPPVSAEMLIRLESVLQRKANHSAFVVDAFPALGLTSQENTTNTPRVAEELRGILLEWSRGARPFYAQELLVGCVTAASNAFVALCEIDGRAALLCMDASGVSEDPKRLLEVARGCAGAEGTVQEALVEEATRVIHRHFDGLRVAGARNESGVSYARRTALKRIAQIASAARPHERARVALQAARARGAVMARMGAEREGRLEALSFQSLPDGEWMNEVSDLGTAPQFIDESHQILALIILVENSGHE